MGVKARIVLALVIGFVCAMAYMAVVIWLGYRQAYRSGAAAVPVRAFWIDIYDIARTGEGYSGTPIGPHMGIVCGIGMAIILMIEELLRRLKL